MPTIDSRIGRRDGSGTVVDDGGSQDAGVILPSLDPLARSSDAATALVADAPADLGADVDATIAWAVEVAPRLPAPGEGATALRWELLATAAAIDVAAARVLEPHTDALAILAEARADGYEVDRALALVDADDGSSWGVYAAEGPGMRLTATIDDDRIWRLEGTKPWCSLATRLSHALVTAWTDAETRALFAVSLRDPGVSARPGPWVARGLPGIVSAPVDLVGVPAAPVGGDGWYLTRRGFASGGIGVAAVWWGGSLPLAAALWDRAARPDADQLARLSAGQAELEAWRMRAVLAEAAGLVDGDRGSSRLAGTVRSIVHDGARRVRDLAVQGLGPGPLTVDDRYAARVADLETYLGQHHGDRDVARLAGRPR